MSGRKIPPRDMTLNGVCFLDGARGMFSQTYRNAEYGVTMTKGRDSRDDPIVVQITVEGAAGSWSTYEAMVADLLAQGWTE